MSPRDSRPRLRPRHTAVALLALASWPLTSAGAQINIESLRNQDVPAGISGSVAADLQVKTGNTELVELGLSGRVNWVRGAATTLLIGDGALGLLSGDRFASDGLLHLRQTHWLNDRIAVEGYGQLNYDRPQLLDLRALGGAGVRLRLASGERGTLGMGLSLMLEEEHLDLPASAEHDERTSTLRNSTFITARLVAGESLVVSSTSYLQPALTDAAADLRVVENLSVGASLTDRLALTVTFDLRYDSGPPDGIAALDTHLRTGLSFSY